MGVVDGVLVILIGGWFLFGDSYEVKAWRDDSWTEKQASFIRDLCERQGRDARNVSMAALDKELGEHDVPSKGETSQMINWLLERD